MKTPKAKKMIPVPKANKPTPLAAPDPTLNKLPFLSEDEYKQVATAPGAAFSTIDSDSIIVWWDKTPDGRALPGIKKALRVSDLINFLNR